MTAIGHTRNRRSRCLINSPKHDACVPARTNAVRQRVSRDSQRQSWMNLNRHFRLNGNVSLLEMKRL
jgi:hypothetical protein